MGTLWLESVLIGNVVHGVGNTVIAHEGVGSLDSQGLVVASSVVEDASCLSLLAIACLIAKGVFLLEY